MELITQDQMKQLLKNGSKEHFHNDHFPVVRLHTPDDKLVWLITMANPKDHNMVAGFFNFGPGIPFEGKIELDRINDLPNKIGMSFKADKSFVAEYPISVYIEKAFLEFVENSKNITGSIWEHIEKQVQEHNKVQPQ